MIEYNSYFELEEASPYKRGLFTFDKVLCFIADL